MGRRGVGRLMPSQQPSVSVLWLARGLLPTTVSCLFVKARVTVLQNAITFSSVFFTLSLTQIVVLGEFPLPENDTMMQCPLLRDLWQATHMLQFTGQQLLSRILVLYFVAKISKILTHTIMQCIKPAQGCVCSHDLTMLRYPTWALLTVKQLTPVKLYLFIRQRMKHSHFWHSSETDWFEPWVDKTFSSLPPSNPHSIPIPLSSSASCRLCWTMHRNLRQPRVFLYTCAHHTHHPEESDHIFPIAVVEGHMTFRHLA